MELLCFSLGYSFPLGIYSFSLLLEGGEVTEENYFEVEYFHPF